tara:strand:+ start:13768 stop:14655 length:888 start_codon:yes stop_codon:yes gene_type:complete
MRKTKYLVLHVVTVILSFYPIFCVGQGKVLEAQSIKSAILGKEIDYTVYLPAGYDESKRSYPVIYLLHGYGGDENVWLQYGLIDHFMDSAIENAEIPPSIVIMPDGGQHFYINDFKGNSKFEDMFFQEFIPMVEQEYRIKKSKEQRAVVGNSMGGYGAFLYGVKHHDMFGSCVPLSAAIISLDNPMTNNLIWKGIAKNLYGMDIDSQNPDTGHWDANDPMKLIQAIPKDILKTRFYFDIGDDDFLYSGNAKAYVELRNMKVEHEFRIHDGGHDWIFWQASIPRFLKFIGKGFMRQ